MNEAEELAELYAFMGVTNLKDAKANVTGATERIKFTESFETLKQFCVRLAKADEALQAEELRVFGGRVNHAGRAGAEMNAVNVIIDEIRNYFNRA